MNHQTNFPANSKALLRSEMRARRNATLANHLDLASSKINLRLQAWVDQSPSFMRRVAVYLAHSREPNVDAFVQWLQAREVLVFAPHSQEHENSFLAIKNDWSNVSVNKRGWREPMQYFGCRKCAAEEMDLILVPALAFDTTGARLGHGGGWYDRALANLPSHTLTIGVAFDFQIVESLPLEVHDQIVAMIVTDDRTLEIA